MKRQRTSALLVSFLLVAGFSSCQPPREMNQTKSNLKYLGIGIHNYAADHSDKLPSDGETSLLSWRVHLLIYIEDANLYDQFHLDEPWDSEHNKTLIDKMPAIFAAPTSNVADQGKTVYLAVTGKDTAFERGAGVPLNVPDGAKSTIMLVEVSDDHAVIWTKPDDWEFNPDRPLDGLMGQHPKVFLALFVDTAIREFPATIDPASFRKMILRNDRQKVNRDDLGR